MPPGYRPYTVAKRLMESQKWDRLTQLETLVAKALDAAYRRGIEDGKEQAKPA